MKSLEVTPKLREMVSSLPTSLSPSIVCVCVCTCTRVCIYVGMRVGPEIEDRHPSQLLSTFSLEEVLSLSLEPTGLGRLAGKWAGSVLLPLPPQCWEYSMSCCTIFVWLPGIPTQIFMLVRGPLSQPHHLHRPWSAVFILLVPWADQSFLVLVLNPANENGSI